MRSMLLVLALASAACGAAELVPDAGASSAPLPEAGAFAEAGDELEVGEIEAGDASSRPDADCFDGEYADRPEDASACRPIAPTFYCCPVAP